MGRKQKPIMGTPAQEVAAGREEELTTATNSLEAALLKEAKRGDSLDLIVGNLFLPVKAVDAQIISLTKLVVELPGLFTLYPQWFVYDFPYTVSPALTIVQSQTADNRLLTAVRALDPRVTPRVDAVYFQLPEAEQYCSWGTEGKAGGVGGVIAIGLWEWLTSRE